MKRDNDALVVADLWLEPGIKMGKGRRADINAELERHRRFVGANYLTFLT